jgi:hypothetical protein
VALDALHGKTHHLQGAAPMQVSCWSWRRCLRTTSRLGPERRGESRHRYVVGTQHRGSAVGSHRLVKCPSTYLSFRSDVAQHRHAKYTAKRAKLLSADTPAADTVGAICIDLNGRAASGKEWIQSGLKDRRKPGRGGDI